MSHLNLGTLNHLYVHRSHVGVQRQLNSLHPLQYNTLRAIESQSLMLIDILLDIDSLLVEHGVNKDVGISLLHRHFELDDEEFTVHDGLRCSLALPGYVQTFSSFHLLRSVPGDAYTQDI